MKRSRPISPRFGATGLALAGLAGLLLLRAVSPSAYPYLPACPIRRVTGLYCPGCGTARALHALLAGDLAAASDLNLFLVLLLPLLAGWGLLLFLRTVRDNQWQVPPVPGWVLGLLLVAMAAFVALRNLPMGPGAWLAP